MMYRKVMTIQKSEDMREGMAKRRRKPLGRYPLKRKVKAGRVQTGKYSSNE